MQETQRQDRHCAATDDRDQQADEGEDQRGGTQPLRQGLGFVGLSREAPTDIVMLVLEEHIVRQVLAAIYAAGKFDQPGTGIAFVLPVESVVGLESQLERFKQEVREQYF